MSVLSREAILDVNDVRQERVSVPEWGGDVLLRSITSSEYDTYIQSTMSIEMAGKRGTRAKADLQLTNAKAKLVCKCVISEDGIRLFKDSDVEVLANKSAGVLERLYDKILAISGLTAEETESLGKD